jgi:hypothetical protein
MVHAEDDCHQFLSFRFKFWIYSVSEMYSGSCGETISLGREDFGVRIGRKYIVLTRNKLNLAEITEYFDYLLSFARDLTPYLAFICSSNFELLLLSQFCRYRY